MLVFQKHLIMVWYYHYHKTMNAASSEMTITSDAVAVTFGDFDQNEKAPGLNGNAAASDIAGDGITSLK